MILVPDYADPLDILHQNLLDAGCETEVIDDYMKLYEKCEHQELTACLLVHRKTLLEDLHQIQYKLDCLDYLMHQLRLHEKRK